MLFRSGGPPPPAIIVSTLDMGAQTYEENRALASGPLVVVAGPTASGKSALALDLAEAHVMAVEGLLAGRPSGAYNLGTGKGNSNREILDAVARVVGRPVPHSEGDRRPGDPDELVADSALFQEAFGWSPNNSDLDTIIGSAWAWQRSLGDSE